MPLAFVRIAWVSIETDAPGIPEIDEFLRYFKATWLDGHFAPSIPGSITSTRVREPSFGEMAQPPKERKHTPTSMSS